MQTSVPELMDLSSEPQHVLRDVRRRRARDGTFAANCLLARRLAERGVRFIQLYHRDWDHHGGVEGRHREQGRARSTRPTAALITDLKQRGMLDDTLVDLGRRVRPHADGAGRRPRPSHQGLLACGWPAAASRAASRYGATDELGYYAVENAVHVHDLHATMLHLLGIDHTRFTYRFQGRDFRLTDVAGNVVKPILA